MNTENISVKELVEEVIRLHESNRILWLVVNKIRKEVVKDDIHVRS